MNKENNDSISTRKLRRTIAKNGDSSSKECFKCDYCEQYLSYSLEGVKAHRKKVHDNRRGVFRYSTKTGKVHRCRLCDFATMFSKSLVIHQEVAHARDTMSCEDCGAKFGSTERKLLERHITEEHSSNEFNKELDIHLPPPNEEDCYKCKICKEYLTFHRGSYKKHLRVVHRNSKLKLGPAKKNHECSQCGFKTRFSRSLPVHQQLAHSKPMYDCLKCEKKFTRANQFVAHMKRVHKNQQLVKENKSSDDEGPATKDDCFKCHLCDEYITFHEASFKKHLKEIHENPSSQEKKEPKKWLECDICEFKTRYKRILPVHKKVVHNKAMHECVDCNLQFEKTKLFMVHMTEVHQNRYECKICGVVLRSFLGYKEHSEYIHGSAKRPPLPRLTCDICQKPCSNKKNIRVHIYRHLGINQILIACPKKCGKWITKDGMKGHLKVHENVKNNYCEVCGKAFLKSQYLTIHMRTHTGERPFVCEVCGKAFSQKSPLNKHMQTHAVKPQIVAAEAPHLHLQQTARNPAAPPYVLPHQVWQNYH